MKPFGRSKAELHASNSAIVRWAPSESDRFAAGKDLPSAQCKKKKQGGHKSRYKRCGKDKYPSP